MSKLLQRILSLTRQNGVRRHVVHVASVTGNGTAGAGGSNRRSHVDAFDLMKPQLSGLMEDIHTELDSELVVSSEMGDLAKYYFDGGGKSVRPCIAMCVGHMANHHTGNMEEEEDRSRRQRMVAMVSEMIHTGNMEEEEDRSRRQRMVAMVSEMIHRQRMVAMVSEMIHTASLVHDDILDHAETRRGKESVNVRWDTRRSTMAGDYILGVGSRILSQVGDAEVVVILSQVLADLVQGEFMQLQNKDDEGERFEHYLSKSFNKTASLMAYSCRANAVISGVDSSRVEQAFQYGRNIGIAFQLVDDLLDFIVSADQLGKPAAADLKLGLATAPVLFAAERFPDLNDLIGRRFSEPGDVEVAFRLVQESGGLQETKDLAGKHCEAATKALDSFTDSQYKTALIDLCDKVLNRMK